MQRIVTCVPNISNGRDPGVYNAVADEVRKVAQASGGAVKLLDIDPGFGTNRTVITFAGEPETVLEAALALARKAYELIDMREHHGEHPRHGAVDVMPFVPVSGVSMDECVQLARRAGAALGQMGVPVWLYEYAASRPERRNLSDLRAGEYEALAHKLNPDSPDAAHWDPDFGPQVWAEAQQRTGVCTVGARKMLIAYNINFNTRSSKLVGDIALSIREKGRIARTEDGKFVRDESGSPVYSPGLFEHCKAMGWYIDEYKLAQITMNLTDWEATPPHQVFDTVQELALEKGLRVTGSELVGLIPLAALTEAGRYFLDKQRSVCTGVSQDELIRVAVQSLGLSEIAPFDVRRRVIEFALEGSEEEARAARPLVNLSLRGFADELASSSPAPGGGSVAALAGAMAAGLAAMVPCLSVGKRGFKDLREQLNAAAIEAQKLKDEFLAAIDDDTAAFNVLMDAFRLPKETPEQQQARTEAITAATIGATNVPLSTLRRTIRTLELCEWVGLHGNQNSLSDSGVGASMALACAEGAFYNVLINLRSINCEGNSELESFVSRTCSEAEKLLLSAQEIAGRVRSLMQEKL
ncbi:glutamate formimidoyltransferase [bacterium]|nr:glutamate formimidoyltransferase [bacterium]